MDLHFEMHCMNVTVHVCQIVHLHYTMRHSFINRRHVNTIMGGYRYDCCGDDHPLLIQCNLNHHFFGTQHQTDNFRQNLNNRQQPSQKVSMLNQSITMAYTGILWILVTLLNGLPCINKVMLHHHHHAITCTL